MIIGHSAPQGLNRGDTGGRSSSTTLIPGGSNIIQIGAANHSENHFISQAVMMIFLVAIIQG